MMSKSTSTDQPGTHEDERTVLYKTKSLDGTKPNTNLKTNPNPNTNRIQLFYAFSEYHPLIFSQPKSVVCNWPNIILYNYSLCLYVRNE